MAMLSRIKIFANEPINAQASVISRVMDVRHYEKLESLHIQVVSTLGTPDVKVEYAGGKSPADGDFESFTDHAAFITSSAGFLTPEGLTIIPMPEVKAGYLKLKFTGLPANPTDTLLTSDLLVRSP